MGLKGYQFDRMKISPKADALLYHSMLDGNDRIVKGYKDELKVVATGLNTYISPGACVVQGRMIEIDEEMQLSVSANDSGYVCIVIDLTQNNTSTGEAGTPEYQPVNNQIRLEVVKELVQQDLHNGGQLYTFPLASFNSTGTTIALTKINHNQRIAESGSNENGSWTKFADGTLICWISKLLLDSGATTQTGSIYQTKEKIWRFPIEFIGDTPAVAPSTDSNLINSWAGLGTIGTSTTVTSVVVSSPIQSSTIPRVSITAFGRWK